MVAPPPTGRVTLVFTDVQGSTKLWEEDPVAMRSGLALHDALMRRLIDEHHGYEVKTEGDAFMVSFTRAQDAVSWCLAAQRGLLSLDWPAALLERDEAAEIRADGVILHRGLRVRMGAHLGKPECRPDPVTGRMDYYGPMVNRSARVGGCGHGGQVLVSAAVLADLNLAKTEILDLGEHALKGLASTEHLTQVTCPEIAGRHFPPVKTLDVRKSNLPSSPEGTIGRHRELKELTALFEAGTRLVTLTGTAGLGKTHLAHAAALRLLEHYSPVGGGVWSCDLSDCREAAEVAARIARVLGVPWIEAQGPAGLGRALAALGPVLLVLDNLEQIADIAPILEAWLWLAPEARCLVTSRHALRLSGEHLVELGPLPPSDAAELFRHRAASRGRTLEPKDPDVTRLVELLEGSPLAIELAAARARTLSPAMLCERLNTQLGFLRDKSGARPDRQRTLDAALAWSWELLDPGERELLAQLTYFAGAFSLAAVEAVSVATSAWDDDALELLERLRDKSLVRELPAPGPGLEPRLSLYRMVAVFARRHLEEALVPELRTRHASFFADRVSAGSDALLELGADEHDVELAFQVLLETDPEAAIRLALQREPLLGRGDPTAHKRVLDAALQAATKTDLPLSQMALLCHRGQARFRLRDLTGAAEDYRAAQAIAETQGDRSMSAKPRLLLVTVTGEAGDLDAALTELDQAIADNQDESFEGSLHSARCRLALEAGDPTEGRAAAARAVRSFERLELPSEVANAHLLASRAAALGDDYEDAARHLVEAESGFQATGDRAGLRAAALCHGELSLRRGRPAEAALQFETARVLARVTGDRISEAKASLGRGLAACHLHDETTGTEDLAQARRLAVRLRDTELEIACEVFLAATAIATGADARARERLAAAVALQENARPHRTQALVTLARALVGGEASPTATPPTCFEYVTSAACLFDLSIRLRKEAP